MFTCTGIVLVMLPHVALIKIVFVPVSLTEPVDSGLLPPQPERYSVPRIDKAITLAIFGR